MDSSALRHKVSHARRVASSPRLWVEQVRYWTHGPAGVKYPRSPWVPATRRKGAAVCNICGWSGPSFLGPHHVEAQNCPRCDSIGRDRYLFWALQQRVAKPSGRLRLLETSPRMGDAYRAAMARWFEYVPSDFDERAHRASVRLDLQDIDLPDSSIDVVLTPHVLEHVPDTDRALAELHRVVAPGGRLLVQVPVLQGATAPPNEPEFHDDDTPVFWRFGPDLVERLEAAGFTTSLLCIDRWQRAVTAGVNPWPAPSPEFDVASLLDACRARALTSIADDHTADRFGWTEPYQFLVFDAVRRSGPSDDARRDRDRQ